MVEILEYNNNLSLLAADGKIDFTQLEKKIFKMVKHSGLY